MKENQETQKENKGSIDSVRRALDEFCNANPKGCVFALAAGTVAPSDDNAMFVSGNLRDIAIMLGFAIHVEPKVAEIVRAALKAVDEYEEHHPKQKEKEKQKENENTKNQLLN